MQTLCAGNWVGQNAFFGWSFKPAQVVSMWSAESANWNFATQSCKPGSLRPLDPGTLYIVRKSTVQLPTSADSGTLLAFAAERRAAAAGAIDRYLLPAGRTAANPPQRRAVVDR